MAKDRTIHFISLGCSKNRVDTEVMLGVSESSKFTLVSDAEDAEVIVVNTCGFIDSAKEESIDTILEMAGHKASGRCEKLVVAGCLSQRYPDQLAKELPEVDHFLGSSDMLRLGTILTRNDAPRLWVGDPADYTQRADDPRTLSQGQHSVYVKVAEGCNRSCSFCTIPSFRGKQRSRSVQDIVAEVQRLSSGGTVEINLISQDTVSYGRDFKNGTDLAQMVEAVAGVDGIAWVRVFYLYPEKLNDRLIDLFADHPNVLPYIDMPLQHASDAMLTRMRRGHGGDRLRRLVDRLRNRIDDMVFRTSFIVGHPGETDADFQELCDFVRWARFDNLGVFLYSREEETRSGEMDAQVERAVAEQRYAELMSIQQEISRDKLKAWVGRELDVLVEGVSPQSELLLEGRFWGQAPEVDGKVLLANGMAYPGEIRRALITQSSDYDLIADLYARDGSLPEPPPGADPRPRLKLKRRLPTLKH